jgi:hypothetical protein
MPPAVDPVAEPDAEPAHAVLTRSRGARRDLDLEVLLAIRDALEGPLELSPRSPLEGGSPLPVDAPSSRSEDALSLGS